MDALPCGLNFLHNRISHRPRAPGSRNRSPKIIHHHLRPTRSEEERVAFPQAITRAGDDGDFIVETDVVHFFLLSLFLRGPFASIGRLPVRALEREVLNAILHILWVECEQSEREPQGSGASAYYFAAVISSFRGLNR